MAYKEIKDIELSRLHNPHHRSYAKESLYIFKGLPDVVAEFQNYFAPFEAAFAVEDVVMEKSQRSKIVKRIAEADQNRDAQLETFNAVWRAHLDSPDEGKCKAAKSIQPYASLYKVNAAAQYDKESGQMTEFIQDMHQYCEQAVRVLGLTQVLADMERWNNEVTRLLLARNMEYVDREHASVSKARENTDKAYRRLVKAVNAKAFLAEGTANAVRYDRIIDLMNQNIEQTKRLVLKQK